MNIQEYISSGIIETYVMGAATPEEEQELFLLARQYPEIKAELEAAQVTLEKLAKSQSRIPPSEVKDRIFNAISTQKASQSPGQLSSKQNIRTLKTSSNKLAIAASVLLCGSLVFNIYQYQKLISSKEEIAKLETLNGELAGNNNVQKANLETLANELKIISNTSTRTIRMINPENSDKGTAVVYWDTANQRTYLLLADMPELPEGKQYQLWAFVKGKPVDMGLFDDKKGILLQGKKTATAEQFAITLEDRGNGPVPKGKLMVIGSI